jgi:hypothetical protein
MVDDDSIDIQPWPVMELIGRSVVLATLARRGMLDVEQGRDLFDLETDRFDLSTWARTELQNWLDEREVTLLGKPVGELSDDEISRCEDALIGASTIAWALRVVDTDQLPLPQGGSAEETTLAWAPAPWAKVRQLQSRVRLRSDEDLARERERWELWYWRAVDAPESPGALPDVIAEVESTGLVPIVEGDFANDADIPYSRLGHDHQADIAWLAELRLRTLNWVCGYGSSWESAPLYIED